MKHSSPTYHLPVPLMRIGVFIMLPRNSGLSLFKFSKIHYNE